MILNTKKEDIKISPSQKWKVSTSVPLKRFMSDEQDCLTLWNMPNRMAICITENRTISQFQLGYLSFHNLKKLKTCRDKFEKKNGKCLHQRYTKKNQKRVEEGSYSCHCTTYVLLTQ